MANRTGADVARVRGYDRQTLIEAHVRNRIYDQHYWKESCFGVDAVEFVGRAKAIAYCGSVFGKFDRPTNFVCLLLRMLQIGIDRDTAMEYLYCKSFVYLRLLGAFYIRLVEEPVFVYQALEKLYCDFQDVVYRTETGAFEKTSIDEVVDLLLTKQRVHGVALPRLQPRAFLEKRGLLQPYVSPLDVDDYEDPVIDAEAGGRADSKSVDADGGA